MKTSKPLNQLIPSIIKFIESNYQSHVVYNSSLIDISNGNLLPYVEASMKEELNPRAFERSRKRIPPINIIAKLQNKLSKVYGEQPVRSAGNNPIDNDIHNEYIDQWDLNSNLQYANDLLVINKYCALEPYMMDGSPRMRVLSAKDFIVYSDSRVNPTEMTVFIKFMGTTEKEVEDKSVNSLSGSAPKKFKSVAVFYAYSEDEFISFDEEGQIYEQKDNPYGKIPFIYLRTNNNELLPTPDSDNLPMATLIPKLMTDLNYAVMFGCRSQIVGIDVEMDNVEYSPDSLWVLNSVPGENKSPSLDTIKSDVDVDKVLNLINTQLGIWLDTKGIKTGSIGKATVDGAASGISKLIDESDASAVNRKYKSIFNNAERRLFSLLPTLHDTWLANGESDMTKALSSKYTPSTELIDAQIVPDNMALLEEMKIENELGIFSREDAFKRLNPEATEEEIKDKVEATNPSISIDFTPNESEEES